MKTRAEFEGSAVKKAFSRQEWVSACHFHDLTQLEVLQEVSRRVTSQVQPLVLLDLDSTLYEVGPRTYQIMMEWAQSTLGKAYPIAQRLILQMERRDIGYSVSDTFSKLGLKCEQPEVIDAMNSARSFWNERFFTSEYLKYDRPYVGASKFSQELHRLGAQIVYLTGRDEPNMGEGTRANLHRDGFPLDLSGTHLLMKRDFHLVDLEHKKAAAEYIRRYGVLVASFENEPLNLAALYEIFPDAMHVFVDTVCSEDHASPCQGLYRICGFI